MKVYLTMNKNLSFATLAASVLCVLPSIAFGTLLSDPGFDGPYTNLPDTTRNPITTTEAGRWILGGHDNNSDDWDIEGGVASNDTSGNEAQGLTQWIIDDRSMTGIGALSFDLLMRPGSGDFDLYLYVFGWNNGDNAPGVDYENGSASTGDSFIPDGSTNLITGTPLGPEGRLVLAENGAALFPGATTDGLWQSLSADLDFGMGFDNLGVLFYGENSGGTMQLDNVQFQIQSAAAVSAPSTLALLGLAGFGLGVFRRKTK